MHVLFIVVFPDSYHADWPCGRALVGSFPLLSPFDLAERSGSGPSPLQSWVPHSGLQIPQCLPLHIIISMLPRIAGKRKTGYPLG